MGKKITKILSKINKTDIYGNLFHAKNYFSAELAVKAIGFVSIPIFTRLLSQEDYGIVSVFNAYAGIFVAILSLNSFTAISRYYYEKTDDFYEFIGSTFVFLGLILSFTISIYVIFLNKVNIIMNIPWPLPILLIFTCLFSIIYGIYMQILYPQKKSKEAAIISIVYGYSIFILSITITFLLKENRYLGKILAIYPIGLFLLVYILFKIHKDVKFSFNLNHIKYIVIYAFPLIPYSLSELILGQVDRIMINNIINQSAAGLYSLGYTVGMLLLLVIGATQASFYPEYYSFLEKKEYKRLDNLLKKIFSIIVLAAMGLILFGKEILIFLADPKFYDSSKVIPIVVVGYVFYAMFLFYSMYVGYTKKTIFLAIPTLIAGMSNIAMNMVFIPKFGYIAAAYTTIVSYIIMFFLVWITVKYILKQRVTPLSYVFIPTCFMFAFIGIYVLLNQLYLNLFLIIFLKILILIIMTFFLFFKELKIFMKLSSN